MATKAEVERLQAENDALRADNRRLRERLYKKSPDKRRLKRFFASALVALAVALLTVGNLVFWAGNTIVKTDRFVEATSPVIEQPEVQAALAQYTADQIFSNIDVESFITEVLPPRAAFLAPELTKQLQNQTKSQLQNAAATPRFQDTWNETMAKQHERLIDFAAKYKGDGTIDINDIYQRLSQRLSDTKLAFLADKQLPSNIGSITVVSAPWLPAFHNLVVNIDLWRALSLLAMIASLAGAVLLSRNRRRTLYVFSSWVVIAMAATLVALQIGKAQVTSNVSTQYQDAAAVTYQTVTDSLVTQTLLIAVIAALVSLIAWLTSGTRPSAAFRSRTHELASRAHNRVFGTTSNSVFDWLGRHRAVAQWVTLAVAATFLFSARVTVSRLVWSVVALVIVIVAIEFLSTPDKKNKK